MSVNAVAAQIEHRGTERANGQAAAEQLQLHGVLNIMQSEAPNTCARARASQAYRARRRTVLYDCTTHLTGLTDGE